MASNAWTADCEIDGPLGALWLRKLYFEDTSRDLGALRGVVTAFFNLAQGGDLAMRPGIDTSYLAAERSPAVAAEAAKQLTWAQEWSRAGTFAEFLASGALDDPVAEFVVSIYLEAAREATALADPAADWSLE